MKSNIGNKSLVVKRALCAGRNNDATAWESCLNKLGFRTQSLIDANTTSKNFKNILGEYFTSPKANDHIICTYSGHGISAKS